LLQQHLQDLARNEQRIESIDKQLTAWAKTNHQATTLYPFNLKVLALS
jgi:hypothetical protein